MRGTVGWSLMRRGGHREEMEEITAGPAGTCLWEVTCRKEGSGTVGMAGGVGTEADQMG